MLMKRTGGYRAIPLSARVLLDPAGATREILEAFRGSGANANATAERLGVSNRTLRRYTETLGIEAQLTAIRLRARKEGWIRSARWPEKTP